jgi:hypothetical protein
MPICQPVSVKGSRYRLARAPNKILFDVQSVGRDCPTTIWTLG